MILQGFYSCLTPMNLIVALAGTVSGLIIGALPGLGASIAMTLALPLTFNWHPESALILLASLYCSATYGGSISAILLNTPGTPASGATTFDGFPLAQKGEADIALGLSTMASFVGGIVGTILLLTVAPLITRVVLAFGPSQLFWIAVLSLFIIGALGEDMDKLLRGLLSCGFGLMLSFIGMDFFTGFRRFSFGNWYLVDGLNPTSLMIGCFAISEMLLLIEKGGDRVSELADPGSIRNVIKGCKKVFSYPVNLIRSSLIGSIIGAIPALGVMAASFLAYVAQVNSSKNPESYGKGNYEGVVAPETANNAVTATAMIPTLTVGIPGSGAMVIVLGALTMHGLVPGPDLFNINAGLVYTVMVSYFIINTLMLVVGVLCAGYVSRITITPNRVLVPCVIVFCIIGAYALKGYWQDIVLTVIMGFVGYFMKKNDYPSLGLLMGIILGPITERSFHQALRISGGSYAIFYKGGINIILIALIVMLLLSPGIKKIMKRRAKTS